MFVAGIAVVGAPMVAAIDMKWSALMTSLYIKVALAFA
jgi:hypothetical protein